MTTDADSQNHRHYTRTLELAGEALGRLALAQAAVPEDSELGEALQNAANHLDRAITALDTCKGEARFVLLREWSQDEAEEVEQLFNV